MKKKKPQPKKLQTFDEYFELMFDIVRSETYELAAVDSAEKAEKIARECATELAMGLAYEIPAAAKKAVIEKTMEPARAQQAADTTSDIIKAAIALAVRMAMAEIRCATITFNGGDFDSTFEEENTDNDSVPF